MGSSGLAKLVCTPTLPQTFTGPTLFLTWTLPALPTLVRRHFLLGPPLTVHLSLPRELVTLHPTPALPGFILFVFQDQLCSQNGDSPLCSHGPQGHGTVVCSQGVCAVLGMDGQCQLSPS